MATDVERLAVLIEANTKSYERAMTRMEQRTERAIRGSSRAVGRLDTQLKAMSATAMRMAGAFGIGFAAFRLPSVIGGIVAEASGLAKAADRIGVTTDRLQELHHSAKLADIEVGAVNKSMEQFSRRLGEATTGTGNLYKILAANNVELKNADGTMRPVNELIGDYAELIKNAGSEQERMFLATEAFGRSGMEMVNMLKQGRKGLNENADEARKLGLIIENNLLRDAERVNDQFGRLTGVVGTEFRRAILDAAGGIDMGTDAIADFQRQLRAVLQLITDNLPLILRFGAAIAGAKAGAALGALGGARGRALGGIIGGIGGFAAPEIYGEMGAQAGERPQITVTPPPGFGSGAGGGRTRLPNQQADAAAETRRKQIEKVTQALQLEFENLTRTNTEQRVYNELAKAGVDADSEAGQSIGLFVQKLEEKREAMMQAKEAADFFGNALYDALDGMIFRGEKAEDVLKRLVVQLAQAALKASVLNTVYGLFGVPGGFTPFGGGKAAGGPVKGGTAYMVGERGPEMFVPGRSGNIVPNGAMNGGGGPIININMENDFRGVDPGMRSFMLVQLDRVKREAVSESIGAVGRHRSHNPSYLRS